MFEYLYLKIHRIKIVLYCDLWPKKTIRLYKQTTKWVGMRTAATRWRSILHYCCRGRRQQLCSSTVSAHGAAPPVVNIITSIVPWFTGSRLTLLWPQSTLQPSQPVTRQRGPSCVNLTSTVKLFSFLEPLKCHALHLNVSLSRSLQDGLILMPWIAGNEYLTMKYPTSHCQHNSYIDVY